MLKAPLVTKMMKNQLDVAAGLRPRSAAAARKSGTAPKV